MLVASSLLIVVLAFALVRERRLRMALQRLLAKLLSVWTGVMKTRSIGRVTLLAALALVAGCRSESDARLA